MINIGHVGLDRVKVIALRIEVRTIQLGEKATGNRQQATGNRGIS